MSLLDTIKKAIGLPVAAPQDKRRLDFYFVRQSPDLTDAQLGRIVDACLIQLTRDVAPHWGPDRIGTDLTKATATLVAKLEDAPADNAERRVVLVCILQDPDVAGDLGYHSLTPDGRVYARVFTRIDGVVQSWQATSGTVSHEVVEAAADANVDQTAMGPDGKSRDLELADPVEDESYPVALNDGQDAVPVSNFVFQPWFDGGTGPYDFLGTRRAAGELSPGGYCQEEIDGQSVQVWGTPGRTLGAHKLHPASRTARRAAKRVTAETARATRDLVMVAALISLLFAIGVGSLISIAH